MRSAASGSLTGVQHWYGKMIREGQQINARSAGGLKLLFTREKGSEQLIESCWGKRRKYLGRFYFFTQIKISAVDADCAHTLMFSYQLVCCMKDGHKHWTSWLALYDWHICYGSATWRLCFVHASLKWFLSPVVCTLARLLSNTKSCWARLRSRTGGTGDAVRSVLVQEPPPEWVRTPKP